MTDTDDPRTEPETPVPAPPPADPPQAPANPPKRPHTILGRLAEAVRQQNWFAVALELLIVVAGVVIGFQVTAWGQAQTARQTETQSLREVRDALIRDLGDIRLNAGHHERGEASARLLREVVRERKSYSDTLDAHFGQVLFGTYSVRDVTAYETLKQRGLDTVTDDSLRAAIGHLYGVAYPQLDGIQGFGATLLQDHQIPFYNTHFRDISFSETATPVDYDALLDSTEFAAFLDWHIRIDALQAGLMRGLDEEVTALIARLDAELARR